MSSVTPSQRSEAKRPDPHRVISAPNSDIRMLAYHPDGRRVVSRSGEGTIRVWNLENGQQEGTSMEHSSGSVGNLAVTRDGTRIISCDENGVKVWDIESQEIIQEWTHREGSSKFPIFSNGLVAASHRSSVFIYTIEGRQVYLSIKVGKFVWSMSFSPSGDKLACGTRSDIYVYDVVNGTLLLGPLQGHTEAVDYVLWSHDGSRLFSASRNDNTIRCWNSDTGEHIGEPWKHGNYSLSISLSPDGSKLASTSGGDKTISFWDTFSGSPITQHLQHDGGHFVYAASFSPSGEYLVSAGCCGKIYLWRVPWLEPVDSQQASHAANLNSILPDLSLAPDERQRIFELRMRKLLDLATSKGFHISREVFPSSLPVGPRNAPSTGTERVADSDSNAIHASPIEPSTLVSGLDSNGDAKETHEIDKAKRKFVDILRDIVFKSSCVKDT